MTRIVILLAALGAAAACAADKGRPDSTAARGIAAEPATNAAAADSAAGNVTPAAATPTLAAPVDSAAIASARGTLIAGRKKMDQNSFMAAIRAGMKAEANWPKGPTYPATALLPGRRIVAYYGNPFSKQMGILGELPPEQMLARLDQQIAQWKKADPNTPVQPALHLVSVVAQGAPGRDGKWRLRMDSSLIEKVYGWAKSRNGIMFLDVQVGHSTVQEEMPRLMKFLERPDMHFALDPEFSMHHDKEGVRPSAKIGTMTSVEINWAIQQLSNLVKQKNLPPKILVVHRFTRRMVPDAENIRPTPQVQVVMDMDGWGPPWLKFDSYNHYIVTHPVQYTGFKIFYKNDTKKGDALLTPGEVLQLRPKPMYIQYQ